MRFLFCLFLVVSVVSVVSVYAQEPSGNKYADVPQSAKDILVALKKLDAKIEIGINYLTYNTEVANVYADIRVFVESNESQKYPELLFVLNNISDCHLLAREKWGKSIYSESRIEKFHAELWMVFGKSILWKTASVNVAYINVLFNSTPEEVSTAIRRLPNDSADLSLLSACYKIVHIAKTEGKKIGDTSRGGWVGFTTNELKDMLPRLERQSTLNGKTEEMWKELNEMLKDSDVRLQENSKTIPVNRATKEEEEAKLQKETKEDEDRKQIAIEKAKWRTWTSLDGNFRVEAKFAKQIGGTITLEKKDGMIIQVPREKLCKEDLDWIKNKGWNSSLKW